MKVTIQNKSFCFTGRASVKRANLADIVTSRGGAVHPQVTHGTDYLVVGEKGSKTWAYRGFGNKILRARFIRFTGGKVRIITEKAFWEGVG